MGWEGRGGHSNYCSEPKLTKIHTIQITQVLDINGLKEIWLIQVGTFTRLRLAVALSITIRFNFFTQ